MEWKEQVERIKEMMPCFAEEMIYKMLKQCYNHFDLTLPRLLSPEMPINSGSLLNNFSSPSSSAKSSVASQSHGVSLDKGTEVVQNTEDDTGTASRSNVRALRANGPWSSCAVQAGSDPMALGNNVASSSRNDLGNNEALGSSEFHEYKLFPPPTQQVAYSFPQYGISLMLNDLVANVDQPSELRRLLRCPFLDTPSIPTRSSAAGSQHPKTSTSESCSSEATPSTPFRDPQDPVLDALFECSRYGPIQRPGKMSENAHPFTSSASIHQSPETLMLGNNMSAGRGFTCPYTKLSSYEPHRPLQQHGYMDGGDNMHQNFGNDMPSAQQEVHQGGSSSQGNADASGWVSFPGAGRTPHQYPPNSPAPSDISRTGYDSALHYQAQHQQSNAYRHAGMTYNNSARNHQPDSGAISALPEHLHGGFPGWAPLPAKANNQHGGGSSQNYAY
ncbi:uncharacterized protein LOC104427316 [Eucalyptus grandis]|uniref:uncharacterized protein LOC104427316 n=1 Tax=Eucalyptus grandis TaxID=71139 RepID=UPI00192EEACD|nr:uncharacterized protein LOC104427316 [Eucalyptus grandis]